MYYKKFVFRCHSSLSNVRITGEKILKIIRSLDPRKAQGWDDISINMIKLCDVAIVNPLYLIYKKMLGYWQVPCQLEERQCSSDS